MQSLLKGLMLVLRDSKLWLVSLFLDCWYGKILWFVSWWICTSRIGNSFPYAFNNCHSRNLKAHSRGGANMLVYLNCQEMTSCSFGFALMLWILHGYYSHLASLYGVNGLHFQQSSHVHIIVMNSIMKMLLAKCISLLPAIAQTHCD